ncbi:MAG: alcohol dehydrogenase catalytic domain-containing protein [bacterium]|nr:alcohol dehydrogenase catalytic domain-containing protein [bacterium]
MRASVYSGPKQVSVQEIEEPVLQDGMVMIQVARAGLCGTDLHIYQGHMDSRVQIPLVMGHEMCGTVVALRAETTVKVGDRVVVEPTVWCGTCPACRRGHRHICQRLNFLGIDSPGAFQAFWAVPADRLHLVPDALDDDAGALIEPLAVAVHDVRRAQVELGDRAVVIGGGPIGILVAMAARLDGAEVVISEVNPFRIQKARSLGFEAVNPKDVDLVDYVDHWTDGAGVDLVFEVSGHPAGAAVMTELARVRGKIALVGVHPGSPPVNLHKFFWRELTLVGCRVYEPVDFERAIRLAASGAVDVKSLVTDTLSLAEAGRGFEQMLSGGEVLKVLLDCQT